MIPSLSGEQMFQSEEQKTFQTRPGGKPGYLMTQSLEQVRLYLTLISFLWTTRLFVSVNLTALQ